MKRVAKISLISVGVVVAILVILIGVFLFRMHGEQSQMFSDPVFDSQAPVIEQQLKSPSVLVFSKTNGFRHKEAIPAANKMFAELADENGWSVYFTENAAVFNNEQLKLFDAVVWNNATGPALTADQQEDFKRYIESGGGFVGIHAAGDNSHEDWTWYQSEVVRAKFIGHPMFPQFQIGRLLTETPTHPATQHLPPAWDHEEEWYSFEESPRDKGVTVLAAVDEGSYDPGRVAMGGDHPVIWSHEIGKGRIFYSALGHMGKAYDDPRYRKILEQAVSWSGRLETPRPNVVFILTDDQRADAVDYHEKPLLGIKTPNIDRLAAEGARCSNMFVTTLSLLKI